MAQTEMPTAEISIKGEAKCQGLCKDNPDIHAKEKATQSGRKSPRPGESGPVLPDSSGMWDKPFPLARSPFPHP